jgi:DNA-binding LacI/PurR family transcriptional regulator
MTNGTELVGVRSLDAPEVIGIVTRVMKDRLKARPAVSRNDIVLELRRRITSGELPPGTRLPTHRDLRRDLQANIVTVGRAIDQLKLEGFVDTQGSRGTFVVRHPPHLFRYALVFPSHPSESNWPRFWDALAKEANTVERDGPCEIPVFYDIDVISHPGSDGYRQLLSDVQAHRLAGLIFAAHPWVVKDTPIVREPGIPRVALLAPHADYTNMAAVGLDMHGLITKSLDYLAARGRKRLAVVSAPGDIDSGAIQTVKVEAAKRGLETRPYWLQAVSEAFPKPAQACMHIVMREGQKDRPDALFVMDDNLVESATAGLVDAGVRVPDDLDVVAHCNFPWPTQSVLPVKRIGFDARQMLRECVKSIDYQRQRGSMPPPETIPAIFEDQLSPES